MLEIRVGRLYLLYQLRLEDLHPLNPGARQGVHRMLLQTLRAKQ
jgi:hypothetical protein